jgi:hypothetical protein
MIYFLSSLAILANLVIFDFDASTEPNAWRVVDDGVMGGLSAGKFEVDKNGNGRFFGTVSLANNGGFSSVRHQFATKETSNYTKVVLRVKGDGKNYQFRLKKSTSDYYSYVYTFSTTGKWQNIEIPFENFYPSFRGMTLDLPNYAPSQLEEVAFLIANKVAEDFAIEIDWIELQ